MDTRRQQIIEGAYKAFSKKGYGGATLKEIAQEAGIASAGLIHYYFNDKETLLLEVIRWATEQYLSEAKERWPLGHVADEMVFPPLRWMKERPRKTPEWFSLLFEMYALSMRNLTIREEVRSLIGHRQATIEAVMRELVANREWQLKLPEEELSPILLAIFDGLAFQAMVNPEFDLDKAYGTLEKVLLSVIELKPSPGVVRQSVGTHD